MQQGGRSQPPPPPPYSMAASQHHPQLGGGDGGTAAEQVEAASPISSRPPASGGNLDDMMQPLSAAGGGSSSGGGGLSDMDALAAAAASGEDVDRGGGGSSSGGNRWPRQETLALIRIRSEMDSAFRDATVKGPLWEDVSRKLDELGFKRSAKKCREKFENVHKYYKRTKETRAGRPDGKTYKFFSELEALQSTSTTHPTPLMPTPTPPAASPVQVAGNIVSPPSSFGVSFSNPMPISASVRFPPQPHISAPIAPPPAPAALPTGISFSSDTQTSSSPETEDDDDGEEGDLEGEPSANTGGSSRSRSRKRRRGVLHSKEKISGSTRRMMEFFEGLMKQVMEKQEAMQQKFLEVIEKREQDRMIREEAWRRQEMARLNRENEIMSQERAMAASRDAAIISFLQKVTGQTIQLPSPGVVQAAPSPVPAVVPVSQSQTIDFSAPVPPPAPAPAPVSTSISTPTQTFTVMQQPQQQPRQQQQKQPVQMGSSTTSMEIIIAAPEQQVAPHEIGSRGGMIGEASSSSSRWPKPEVLALIQLRSGLEARYQEAGPKGPLWEEISAGMQRMGYNRSAKRCKEKWENINKYYKKVKESNKIRPEDAKTCPYFHQLDELYQKKILGSGGGSGGAIQFRQEQTSVGPTAVAQHPQARADDFKNKNGGSSSVGDQGNGEDQKPEDIMKKNMMVQQQQNQRHHHQSMNDYNHREGSNRNNVDHEDDDEEEEDYDVGEDEDDDGEELEEERKMEYKIEYQRQNTRPPNGGGNGTPSFLTMVQ